MNNRQLVPSEEKYKKITSIKHHLPPQKIGENKSLIVSISIHIYPNTNPLYFVPSYSTPKRKKNHWE